jgi:hypothetical protein
MQPIIVDLHHKLLIPSYSVFISQVAWMIPPGPVTADDLERDRVLGQ